MISKAVFLLFFLSVAAMANDLSLKMTLSPAGSFTAETNKLRGEVVKEGDKYTAQNLWIKTDDLKTGIDLRDEHFHKHLNSVKYPKITLTNVEASGGQGTGVLNICGETNKINFTYKNITEKQLKANFKVKPSAFKIKEAKFLEISVEDDVEVVATIDVK